MVIVSPQCGQVTSASVTSEVDVRLDLQPVGTAGFDASGGVSRRCRAEPGKRSVGAAGAEAQPATP